MGEMNVLLKVWIVIFFGSARRWRSYRIMARSAYSFLNQKALGLMGGMEETSALRRWLLVRNTTRAHLKLVGVSGIITNPKRPKQTAAVGP
jgi:hypothetical protein